MRRSSGTTWQIAGATVMTVWLLAACGLEAGTSAATAQGSSLATVTQQAPAAPFANATTERRIAATIETGQIATIERIVVTPPSRASDGLTVYRVVVRLQNGESREFTEPSLGELKVGDRVQVVNSGSDPTT